MRNRIVIGIVIGIIGILLIGLAGLAVYLNFQSLNASLQASTEPELTVPVVVAARDLASGDFLLAEDLEIVNIPPEFLPRTALSSISDVADRIINADLVQGEMVLANNLVDPTNVQGGGIAFILREDHVLFAFPATDLMSQSGIIKRGDLVDIYASINVSSTTLDPNTLETITNTGIFSFDVLQGTPITALVVEVIESAGELASSSFTTQTNEDGSIGTIPLTELPEANTVTVSYLLALNPQDALILKNLRDQNAIFDLLLRNPGSTLSFNLDPVSDQYLIELYGLYIIP